jgi:hypothetical protein
MAGDLNADPETVITDLLADLMHWCNARNIRPRVRVAFDRALRRACAHYGKEINERR